MPWLNQERITTYPKIFLACYFLVGVYLFGWGPLFHTGLIDGLGRPLGTDFVAFWAASDLAVKGDAAAVYDPARIHAVEQRIIGARFDLWAWNYPPTFLLMVLPLSLLPYLASYATWLGVTLSGYLLVLRRLAPHPATLWLALAFPGTFQNFFHGQNGFLSAVLLGGGLMLMGRHPLAGGFLLGLLTYKPHLAILIPLALLAGRQWRALGAMLATAAALAGVSAIALGLETWQAFFRNTSFSVKILETGGAYLWQKMPTAFGTVLLAGGSLAAARLVQGLITLGAVAAMVWVWRRGGSESLRSAILVLAILLATPYAFEYDLAILALPLAWLAWEGYTRGFRPGEEKLLLLGWLTPLLSPTLAQIIRVQVAPLVFAGLLILGLRRWTQAESSPS